MRTKANLNLQPCNQFNRINPVFRSASFVLLFVLYLPLKAGAWGVLGHRIVGQIAAQHLGKKARGAVKKILGNESLAMASNWADFVKSDQSYDYMYNWHFVNIPEGMDRASLILFLDSATQANVYNKTLEMSAVLRSKKSSADEKKLALRVLIHLVGDMNQPMHIGRSADLGGNKIQVTWFGEQSNLHRIWDEALIGFQQLSYTEYARAIDHPDKEMTNLWKKMSLSDFVYSSYEASNRIYAATPAGSRLSYQYNYDFVELLNLQLLKGGICLANILNDIYA